MQGRGVDRTGEPRRGGPIAGRGRARWLPFVRMHPCWLVLVLSVAGCGTSLRVQHQSDVYFERCHSADFDPSIPAERKHACWAKWLQHYTVGQSPSRVRYARERLGALERGEAIEPLPGLQSVTASYTAAFLTSGPSEQRDDRADDGGGAEDEDAPASAAVHPAAPGDAPEAGDGAEGDAPSSSSADRPDPAEPEAEAEDDDDDESERTRRGRAGRKRTPSPPAAHGGPCKSVCIPRWKSCTRPCEDHARGCVEACRTEYRTCMAACY